MSQTRVRFPHRRDESAIFWMPTPTRKRGRNGQVGSDHAEDPGMVRRIRRSTDKLALSREGGR